jgi:hypothetical protein
LQAKALEADLSSTTGRGESALILRRAGIAALVVSIGLGMMSNVLFLAAFSSGSIGFRADAHPCVRRHPGRDAALGRSSRPVWVLPRHGGLRVRLWRQLRPANPLIADLSTMAAVGYALTVGVGAAVLAMVA